MRYLYLMALAALAACGDSPAPTYTHIGTWDLKQVSLQALPQTLQASTATGCGVTVEGGRLRIREDGTYDLVIRYGPALCESEFVAQGSYTIDGNDMTLQNGSTQPIAMLYSGVAVDWVRGTTPYTFRK